MLVLQAFNRLRIFFNPLSEAIHSLGLPANASSVEQPNRALHVIIESSEKSFYDSNLFTAIISIGGVIIGALVTYFVNMRTSRRQTMREAKKRELYDALIPFEEQLSTSIRSFFPTGHIFPKELDNLISNITIMLEPKNIRMINPKLAEQIGQLNIALQFQKFRSRQYAEAINSFARNLLVPKINEKNIKIVGMGISMSHVSKNIITGYKEFPKFYLVLQRFGKEKFLSIPPDVLLDQGPSKYPSLKFVMNDPTISVEVKELWKDWYSLWPDIPIEMALNAQMNMLTDMWGASMQKVYTQAVEIRDEIRKTIKRHRYV